MILTRKHLRHVLQRTRNERIAELGPTEPGQPEALIMSGITHGDLLLDDDPLERDTLDFEGFEFMGVPIQTNPTLPRGEVQIRWVKP